MESLDEGQKRLIKNFSIVPVRRPHTDNFQSLQ